jgi:hypothetical protein
LFAIQSLTVFGFSGSAALYGESELSHDFDSGFFGGRIVGGLATAYSGRFGSGFFSPRVSPVLLKKFFVPVPTLSKVEGCFWTTLEIGRLVSVFGSALVSEDNGESSDQLWHTVGHTPAKTAIAMQADKTRAILTTMITAFNMLSKRRQN